MIEDESESQDKFIAIIETEVKFLLASLNRMNDPNDVTNLKTDIDKAFGDLIQKCILAFFP